MVFRLDSLDRLAGRAPASGGALPLPRRKETSTGPHPASRAVPILEVAAALGLELVSNKARCLNPSAHQNGRDDHPSLVFFPDSRRFKCFVCGVHGDAIDLVKAVLGLSFTQAVTWLTDLAGGRIPEVRPTTPSPDAGLLKVQAAGKVFEVLYDQAQAPTDFSPAGRYLLSRGLKPAIAAACGAREIVDASAYCDRLLSVLDEDKFKAAGLVSQKGHFLFAYHTLLFFYLDQGRPVFVQARDISGRAKAKELRPRELLCPVPFNVDVLQNPRAVVYVCEGCIDTLSAIHIDLDAVGIPGVQSFRDEWFPLFRSAGRVVILFDNDEAGRTQAIDLRARFRRHGFLTDVCFPAIGKDINEMLMAAQPKGDAL